MDMAQPEIVISSQDHSRLMNLAEAALNTHPDVASFLMEELARATITNGENLRPVVGMGSWVEFRDDTTGRVRSVQLVYPSEADSAHGKISVLTPIGAALIGLFEGQSIQWQTRGGEWKTLTVLKVREGCSAVGYLDV